MSQPPPPNNAQAPAAQATRTVDEEAVFRVRLCGAGIFLAYQHTGRMPTEAEGVHITYQPPSDPALEPLWRGPYIPDPAYTQDPWGNPIEMIPSEVSPVGYDVRSMGPDGKPGGGDDIFALEHRALREAFAAAEQTRAAGGP